MFLSEAKLNKLFLFATALLLLQGAFADCLYMGKQVENGKTVTIDCVMLHGTTVEYVEKCGMLICKGTELYFANERTTQGTSVHRTFTCDPEQKYGYNHPWYFVTAVAGAVYTNTSACRGSSITVTLPKQFSIVCIDGSIKTGYPSFFVGTLDNGQVKVLGHNCNGGFSSSACNTLFEQGANATVIVPFVPLEQKTLDVFAAMQTKYDYQITAEHLPFGVVESGYQTLTLIDPSFDLSIDKASCCTNESINISGKAICCGEAGTNVTINIKDSSGNTVKQTNAMITADNKYATTINLTGISPGKYTIEAVAPLADKLPTCKRTVEFELKSPWLKFGTDKAVVPAGSSLKIAGSTQCCAKPNEKAKITLRKGSTMLASTEANLNADGHFEKLITLPSNETGPVEITVGFENTNPACTKKASIVVIFPDVMKNLIAENLKEGQKARLAVECTANMPVVLKVYSYDTGDLIAEQNYTCNSGIVEIGPELKAGVYDARAEASIPFCIQCKLQRYFLVTKTATVPTPEINAALVVFCAIIVLLIAKAKRGSDEN